MIPNQCQNAQRSFAIHVPILQSTDFGLHPGVAHGVKDNTNGFTPPPMLHMHQGLTPAGAPYLGLCSATTTQ